MSDRELLELAAETETARRTSEYWKAEHVLANTEIDALKTERDALEREVAACASALPGPYYMDPPDGGGVSISEQLKRMARDAARYRWLRDQMWSQCNTRHFFSLPIRWGLDDNAHAGDSMDAAIDAAQRAGFDPTLTFKGSSNSNQTQAEQTNEPTVWRWKHVKDERWVYGAQPHHLRPDTWSGAQLVGYHIVEPLYAHPPRPAVRLTTHEIHELLIDDTGCERGGVSLARAVESAVLKRNGMEVSDDA